MMVVQDRSAQNAFGSMALPESAGKAYNASPGPPVGFRRRDIKKG